MPDTESTESRTCEYCGAEMEFYGPPINSYACPESPECNWKRGADSGPEHVLDAEIRDRLRYLDDEDFISLVTDEVASRHDTADSDTMSNAEDRRYLSGLETLLETLLGL
ncbi:hypothetical protein GGP94_003203 [Salinibacter ruber]|uniref:hypothetical protein n=1 Tax=Salinibacter ruber TaxID=146919 RepID=UPI0021697842|nr:hypothetical protein [Salinibacter ruber]MCS4162755.1 hypothetical protein [Salinibacter ruber]